MKIKPTTMSQNANLLSNDINVTEEKMCIKKDYMKNYNKVMVKFMIIVVIQIAILVKFI